MENVLKELDAGFDEDVKDLLTFLSIPSVSGDPAMKSDVARAALWLRDKLLRAGFSARVEETPGHPVVTAEFAGPPGAPVILVYGHYDVQPALLEDGWTQDPFTPRLSGGAIVGRGASDDKGQLYCHVLGAKAHFKASGGLPVTLKAVFEGEEECGSANLEAFLSENRERLRADAVLVSDTSRYAADRPALTVGLRGLLCLEIKLKGANRDLHSGSFGGAAPNPANALCAIIAGLRDSSGRIAVPGFYDRVLALTPEERADLESLGHDEVALAASLGVTALPGESGFDALTRMWARPTFDVNGLYSGYQGEGPKTVIPHEAGAKLSFRLVPDQDPDEAACAVEKRIRELCPDGLAVSVFVQHAARPVLLPGGGPFVEAAKRALKEAWGTRPVLIREGGSIPVVETFARLFGVPVVLLGMGRPDDGAHGPDERFFVEDLRKGAEVSARLMALLGSAER